MTSHPIRCLKAIESSYFASYSQIIIISDPIMPDTSPKTPARIVDSMPEAFVSNARISTEVSRRVADGRLRKLATRLYTRNLEDSPEAIVRRNLWGIVAGYFPNAVVADRTAFEGRPAADGSVCLVAPHGRTIQLPGATLRVRRGAPPGENDRPYMGQPLHMSSAARTYLDNLCPSRASGGKLSRTVSRKVIEERLERLLAAGGVEACNRLRDEARREAEALGRMQQWAEFNQIVGALAGTREAKLTAPIAQGRARGQAYDPERALLFESLYAALQHNPAAARIPAPRDGIGSATLAFFEAYFSNYIEGTEFEVEEAANIVFRGHIPQERPADAHDILGVWRIVSDPSEMRRAPKKPDELIEILRDRHAIAMQARPEASPGSFKSQTNRAGSTGFVAPDAVIGTLRQGFDIYANLQSPFHRAVFMHFMISEVHPFADGNGRLARVMMNAELIAGGEERIVIPTVYRGDYIAALRALSHRTSAEPQIRMLDFTQQFTAAVQWQALEPTFDQLRACNAFETDADAEYRGIRLQMPQGKTANAPEGNRPALPDAS